MRLLPGAHGTYTLYLISDYRVIDISSEDFPGIFSAEQGFSGPRPNTKSHPNLRLDKTMVSVPKVVPGDMVFWHCVCLARLPEHGSG